MNKKSITTIRGLLSSRRNGSTPSESHDYTDNPFIHMKKVYRAYRNIHKLSNGALFGVRYIWVPYNDCHCGFWV